MSRLIIVMAVLAVGSLLVCAGSAYMTARVIDAQHIDERRTALRAGVDEMRTMLRVGDAFDPRMIRLLEQSAGIAKLKFVSEPGQDGREEQPVMDMQGRIAGFLTWTPEFPLTELVRTYVPALAGIAFGLVLIAGYSLRQLRRARWHNQAQAEQVRRAAETDPLTGLPTEPIVLEKLGAILASRNIQQRVTVAVLELDGIDDARRHIGAKDCGNLIAAIAGRLAAALPETAVLGRGGGERFMVVLPAVADVMPILRSAIEAVSQPHWFDSVVRVSAHAGFAHAPRDAVLRDELARAAGQALHVAAKKGPGAIVGYDSSMDAVSGDIQFIRRELPRAISAGELELHYQPIVTPDGEHITGVEALLRWTHPVRGAIPPATFIPVAEQTGLMDTLGEFVLRRALTDARRWPQFYIGVNLSPVQVKDHAIVDLVGKTLAETGIEPSRLMLEITEGVLVDDPDEMIRRIGDLRALGVRIALDDFGSGYSNLGYLQRFSIDKLKIDRAFVTPLGKAANAGVMIQAIVTLGQTLGLTVLVEGVETEEQRALLRMAGCDEMQGFLFARPAPAKAIDRLAAQHNSARTPLRSVRQPSAAAVLTG